MYSRGSEQPPRRQLSEMATTIGTYTICLPPGTSLDRLPQQQLYNLTSTTDKREVMLRDLLVADHGTIAPLREPNLILHSHMPHVSRSYHRSAGKTL